MLFAFLERAMSKGQLDLQHFVEPQEKANPDKWSSGLGKPFSGVNGVQAGGGEEPEVNYDMNPTTAMAYGSTESCNKKTGQFLKSCVYRSDSHLRSRKLDSCKADLGSIAASCVFGPVKER